MKKRLFWLVASCLVILSLVLAACAPAVTEEKKKEEVTKEEVVKKEVDKEEVTVEEKVTPGAEVPKYGGTYTFAIASWVWPFDEIAAQSPGFVPGHLMNDELQEGDWTKGLAGTGETTFTTSQYMGTFGLLRNHVAESYELLDDSTEVYHIRKGIHFQQEGPAKGRELDANDVAFSINRVIKSPVSFHGLNYPPPMGAIEATATDKWTVVVKTYPGKAGYNLAAIGDMLGIIAPEAVQKYGNLKQWETAVGAGSGPFIITDYIPANSISFKRNPNYWQKDPFRPENQLPYVDKVNMMIIFDKATRLAAMRTGKLDVLHGPGLAVIRDDWESLTKTNPELKWRKDIRGGLCIGMRVDKPELPWFDIKVRQALMKAIDRETILKDYYKGDAVLFELNVAPIIEYKELYIPLEEMPEAVQTLYKYDPKRAKELLAEAGYPNGFKAEVILKADEADEVSMIAAYWAKIGVDLQLQVKEVGAYTAIAQARAHPQMITGIMSGMNPHNMHRWRQAPSNSAYVMDPICLAGYDRVTNNWNVNWAEFVKAAREVSVRAGELAAYVALPSAYYYTLWWPWVENYHGEYSIGYYTHPDYIKFIWVNEALKKETLAKR